MEAATWQCMHGMLENGGENWEVLKGGRRIVRNA